MIVKWDHFSKDRDENKKYLKPPPRHGIYYEGYNYTTDPITGLIPALPRDPGHSSWPWAPLTAFLRRFRFGSPYDVTYDRLAATGTGKRIHKWLVCFFFKYIGFVYHTRKCIDYTYHQYVITSCCLRFATA